MSLRLDILDSVFPLATSIYHIGRADDIRECIAITIGLEWALSTEGPEELSTPILEELYPELVALSECPV
jgi:hypothetical protein